MARGSIAKDEVVDKISKAFGSNFIGEYQKKYYVWANDGGERVQIAIALTCPKVMIGEDEAASVQSAGVEPLAAECAWNDWSNAPAPAPKAVELTQEEKDNIARLRAELGL